MLKKHIVGKLWDSKFHIWGLFCDRSDEWHEKVSWWLFLVQCQNKL